MNYTLKTLLSVALLSGITGVVAAADPGFDILNKSKGSIWITVKNGDDTVLDNIEIPIQDSQRAKELAKTWIKIENPFVKGTAAGSAIIALAEPTTLEIYTKDPEEAAGKSGEGAKSLKYTFTKNKTIYVTYDSAGLRPQTGILKGWLGITEKKYDMGKNVKETDIKKVKKTEPEA